MAVRLCSALSASARAKYSCASRLEQVPCFFHSWLQNWKLRPLLHDSVGQLRSRDAIRSRISHGRSVLESS